MPFLIDGHNLIAATPGIDLADEDDEAQLLIKIRGFAARTGKKCTVIFDGGLPGGVSNLSTKSVKVVFAASQHSSADSLITRRIRNTPDAPNWTVVSSDHEIRSVASRHRMKTQTSQEFARRLQRKRPRHDPRGEELHPPLPPDEVDAWLQVFGYGKGEGSGGSGEGDRGR